jgi:small-conductance mechanosensitive channel
MLYKKMALCKFWNVDDENMGRLGIVNRIIDVVIVTISSLVLLDYLQIKMNNAMRGIFAFGGAGTLAFTLASRDIATQLLAGVQLIFSDKMYAGDVVQFGDGTTGKVIRLGWVETTLRGSDNLVTRVPNTLLSSQKVSNVSRIRQCQVKQTLRFHYKDVDKMPNILEDIREEIKFSCPRLITDNSRPFRVFWTNFNEDHLEVVVDTHHNIAPIGDAYWINRQNVLMAIAKALRKHDVEFAA